MKKYTHSHRSIDNTNIVAEEEMGYGANILPKYHNRLSPDIANRIHKMSIIEVIS